MTIFIEKRVDFSEWVPGGFGTADHLCFDVENEVCHVSDLKYGRGVKVRAKENSQLMLYALGAYADFNWVYPIMTFHLSIIQPRLNCTSEWEISTEGLLKWASAVKEKAALALSKNPPLNPGEVQCRWCRAAKAGCPAIADKNLAIARTEFAPQLFTNPQIAEILEKKKMITDWLKGLETYAKAQLHQGIDVPGFKLVRGRPNRKWKDADRAANLMCLDLNLDQIYPKKIISPAQAEKLLGKGHSILNENAETPLGDPTLVSVSDPRPALDSEVVGSEFNVVA